MKPIRTALGAILLCGFMTLSFRADAALTAREQKALFPSDVGPDTIDISAYPEAQQKSYALFLQRCSRCHTPARPINSPLVSERDWRRYVRRMHLRAHEMLLNKKEADQVIDFLAYDAQVRKVKNKAAFDQLQKSLKERFKVVQAERSRLQQNPKTKEQAPYTGTP